MKNSVLLLFFTFSILAQPENISTVADSIVSLINEQDFNESGKVFSQNKRALRKSGPALLKIGAALYHVGQLGQAEGLIEKALTLPLSTREKHLAKYYMAEFQILRGQYRDARKNLESINLNHIDTKKIKSAVLSAQGFVLLHMFQPEKAKKQLDTALKLDALNRQARDDRDLLGELAAKDLLVYGIQPLRKISSRSKSGYYCFQLQIGAKRKDMIDFVPFLKLIFKNVRSEKRYGFFANFGDESQVCAALPVGTYQTIKMASGRKKARYPGVAKFEIKENQIFIHFAKKILFDSPAPANKFNQKSRVKSTIRSLNRGSLKRFIKKINYSKLPVHEAL